MPAKNQKRWKDALWLWGIGLAIVGAAAYAIWGMMPPPTKPIQTDEPTVFESTPAPDVRFTDVRLAPWKLSDFQDRPTVISFIALWCGVCEEEVAQLEQLQQAHAGKYYFILVDVDSQNDSPQQLRVFADAHQNSDFFYVFDGDGAIVNAFGVQALQTTFVIGTDGMIAYKDETVSQQADLEQALAKL